ncbi:MAG TPA: protein kinase [Pirellulaceae bacterium]|nr:protein kinase [Pirellulaceae bacterium]
MANGNNPNPNPNQPNGLANALGLPPLPNAPRMRMGMHRDVQQQPPPQQQQAPQGRLQMGTHRAVQQPNQQPNQPPNQPPQQPIPQPPQNQPPNLQPQQVVAEKSGPKTVQEAVGVKPPTVESPETQEQILQAEIDRRQAELKRMKNYVGALSGAAAEEALANQLDGTWILRYSDSLEQVAVSIKESDTSIKHYPTIRDTPNGPVSSTRDELIKQYGVPEVGVHASLGNDTNYSSLLESTDEPENRLALEWRGVSKWFKNFLTTERGKEAAKAAPSGEVQTFRNQASQAESAAKDGDYGRALSLGRAAVELAKSWFKMADNAFGIVGELMTQIWDLDSRIDGVARRDGRFAQVLTRMKDDADQLSINEMKNQEAWELIQEANRMIDDWEESRASRQDWLNSISKSGGLKAYKLPPSTQQVEGQGTYGSVKKLVGPGGIAPTLVIKLPNDSNAELEFEHEADVYAYLGEHPNIARCLGMQSVGGKKGLVMQALKGDMDKGLTNMKSQVEDGSMSQSDYWGVVQYSVAKTLEALQFMAAKGIVHTDLKPNNIMFDDDGNIKLIDMGLAKESGQAWGGVVGYGAPEAPKGKGTHKTDVFGMGGITYEAVEGDRFQHNRESEIKGVSGNDPNYWDKIHGVLKSFKPGETALHLSTPEEGGKSGNFAAETAYTQFVNWMMDPDPTKRPTAAEALKHAFLKDRLIDDARAKKLLKEL